MAAVVVMVACLGAVNQAVAAVTNDSFATAVLVTGEFGTTNAVTTGYTAEGGEPNHAGLPPRATAWFKWTATVSELIQFDTYGSSFSTVLAVYTGSSVGNLNFVVGNAADSPQLGGLNFPTAIKKQSIVKFNAKAGQTYYIVVGGASATDSGECVLNWAHFSAGVFRFTTNMTFVSEMESSMLNGTVNLAPSLMGARITVTRVGGACGRALVDIITTPGTASSPGDYGAVQTNLTFDDWEMSKSFVIPVFPNPDFNNRSFLLTLANPRLDPAESLEIAPPRLDPVRSSNTVTIVNFLDLDPLLVASSGSTASFERRNYRVRESAGQVIIYLQRPPPPLGTNASRKIFWAVDRAGYSSPELQFNTFLLQAGSDYATPNPVDTTWPSDDPADFEGTPDSGVVTWGQDDFDSKPITITTVIDDDYPEFNEDIKVKLFAIPGAQDTAFPRLGQSDETTLTILYDDYPSGALDENYNPDYSITADPPNNSVPGANNMIFSTALQADGKCLIAGDFTAYNTISRNRIARVNTDGTHDASFNPGGGADEFISSIALASGNIVIGGGFTSFDGQSRYHVAQLDANGALDASFNPGLGADDTVWAVAVQADGKVLIGGEFNSVNGFPRAHIARLNSDGSVDQSFNPTNTLNAAVQAIAVAPDGTIYVGGDFTLAGAFSRNAIARLKADGTLDTTFDPRTGANGSVYSLALQTDGKLLIGGSFDVVDLRGRNNIARLNSDGTLDTAFDPGRGANDSVYAIKLVPGGRILIGGVFTSVSDTRRVGLARLFPDGTVDTSFLDTAYNHFAGIQNPPYFTEGATPTNPKSFILSLALQEDGDVIIAGNFRKVGGGRWLNAIQPRQAGEQTEYGITGVTRAAYRNRENLARLMGNDSGGRETDGPGNIGLAASAYSIDENAASLYVKAVREHGTLGHIEATFSVPPQPAGPGAAETTTDYTFNRINPAFTTSWSLTRNIADGIFGTNNVSRMVTGPNDLILSSADDITVIVSNRAGIQGNRTTSFNMDVPSGADVFFLGGENIPLGAALGRSAASLQINEVDTLPGVISFTSAGFTVNENGTNAVITLTRTNGSAGSVSVVFSTANGTAINNVNYTGVSNTVAFGQGITNKTVLVPILNNATVQADDLTVQLALRSPVGGATIGLSNAVLSIVDDDFLAGRINFSTVASSAEESSGTARVVVTRSGGNLGALSVQYATQNGTALAGTHYLGQTNTLSWNNGDSSPRNLDITLLPDGLVTPNLSFNVRLSNPTIPGALGARTNTQVTILNGDFYGSPQFSAASYNVSETGGYATVVVNRVGGSAETLSVNYATSPGTAVSSGPLPNFVATNGTLVFGPGVVSRTFTVPILNDGVVNTPISFFVNLSGLTPGGATLGSPVTAQVNIIDAQSFNQPAGSLDPEFNPAQGLNADVYALSMQPGGLIVAGGDFTTVNGLPQNRLARFFSNGVPDTAFMAGLNGANGAVRALITQSDTRLVVGGLFTTFNSVNRSYLTRLNTDGTLDPTFNPGSGADAPVYALAETSVQGSRRLYAAGGFTTFNGFSSPGVVRLLDSGAVDTGFNIAVGVDGPVYSVAVYPTNTIHAGKVVIGGAFGAVNGVARANIARLNVDGSLDTTFNPGSGANAEVRSVVLQPDGKVLIGGALTSVAGTPLNRVARLNLNGTVDNTFAIGSGCNEIVYALALQADNRIVVGGDFTQASDVTRRRITRLLPDGQVDPSINFGSGANGFIDALLVQPDNHIVLGGGFTAIQGQPVNRIARIFGGAITGAGQVEFNSPLYVVNEDGTNVLVTMRRIGGTAGTNSDGSGSIVLTFSTGDNTALAGINYTAVTQQMNFPVGEVEASVLVPVQQDFQITPDLLATFSLSGAPELLGPQPYALLQIINVDSAVHFSSATYARNEDAIDGLATITIVREGSTAGTATVIFDTTTNGTAVAGVNYLVVTNVTVTFLPGESSRTVTVPLLHNLAAEGNKTVSLALSVPIGTVLLNPSSAILTINDVDQAPGTLLFSQTAYIAGEGATNAVITVVRSNGVTGVVSVNINTIPGTATPGVRYVGTNGVLTFADGQSVRTFSIGLIDDNIVQGDQSLLVNLSGATGGATISEPTNVSLTILDNDVAVNFTSPAYVVNETAGIVNLGVQRLNGSNGTVTVNFKTVNGTAFAGTNYTADNRTLTFSPGEVLKTVGIAVQRDPRVTGNLSFSAVLSNASAGVQLVAPNPASVIIVDNDPGISFTNATYSILESGTNLVVTVIRVNANSGDVAVNFATADQTAVAGQDYTSTSGILTFLNGETEKTITIPILDNQFVQSDRTFLVNLFNPTGGAQLTEPSSIVATIVDNDAGLRFSTDLYQVFENGVQATITVLRTNYTNSAVSVDYTTQDGTGIAGTNYTATSGTLLFTNGETVKTFTVGITDDSQLTGDHTVLLKLQNAQGNAAIINPGAATLNISDDDGSLIIPAGTALVSEATNNGVIDPGETLTVLFGFRNSGGTNAVNMTATLLSSNGIVPVTTSQNYGSMVVGAPVKSRPYTFVANGTNGQTVVANFALSDNGTPIGSGLFTFTVGSTTLSFTNGAAITITDRGASPAPVGATPYPSTINVNGALGTISKVTVTLSNYSHMSSSDVGALLVNPAGQKTLLMANCGGFNNVNNIWLQFDDAAAGSLSSGTAPASGAYKPTSFAPLSPFPSPAPAGTYSNSLAAFNGSNPNGTWSLFVLDDTSPGAGSIANGWSLAITRSSSIPSASDLSLGMTATPQPGIAAAQLTYTLWLTNNGPATATSVSVADTLPAGVSFVSATTATGGATNVAGVVTWTVGSMANGATASLALTVIPSTEGTITNTAVASSAVSDLFTQNNAATLVSAVNVPSADLVLGMNDSPDPVVAGAPLTYQITVTNLGPATATGVVVTNPLLAGLNFTSVAASQGTAGQSGGTVWANLGSISSGGNASITLVTWVGFVGTVTNVATVSSPIIDPLKANNTASVKTTVTPQLTASASGGIISITTPGVPGSVLDFTASLTPPVIWTPLLTNPPAVVNLPLTTTGNRFFRLRAGP